MVVFMHFVTGVVLLSTFILCAGHVMLRRCLWFCTEVGNEVIVGFCRLFSAVCNPRIILIVQV